MTNPVEPVKCGVVRLIPVRTMLRNKSIEIADSKHDTTGFATKIMNISPQLLAGTANAEFGKTQFFRHPVCFSHVLELYTKI